MFLTRHNGYIASRRTSHLFFAVDLAVILDFARDDITLDP